MTFATHPLMFCLWALMITAEWSVAVLAFTKIRNLYPYFTSLLGYMAVKSLVLFWLRTQGFHDAYFYTYYRMEFGTSALYLASVAEVFTVMFAPLWTVPRAKLVALALSVVAMVAAVSRLASQWQSQYFDAETAFYRTLDRTVCVSSAILLAGVLLFASHFEMPYRSRVKGITAGLFLMAYVSLVTVFLPPSVGREMTVAFTYAILMAHFVTLAIWAFHVKRPEVLRAEIRRSDLAELQSLLSQFKLALSFTPTSCGLTMKKRPRRVMGEERAKAAVNHL